MFIPNLFLNIDAATLAILVPAIVLLFHLVPYLADPRVIRALPGPFLARFSDAWLGWVSSQGHRSEVVHELHRKHGTL
jgi:benzoate 4-monooxygenase